ncbi:MAG: MFS transporter [Alphaproteobacteria bacterium]|nr:MFS transporter [Alphaproteobacteria bacterium]
MPQTQAPGRSLIALIGVVLTAMIGFGLFVPVFPFLALDLGATASETTLAMGAYSVGQLIAAPIWGRLSDRFGRKPILIIGLIGAAASYCLLAGATSIYVMGGARLLGGLMAGNVGAAFAAAGDLSNEHTRARNMGLISAVFALGFIIGPALGGVMVGNTPTAQDFANVCYLAAGFATVSAIVALALFRETHTRDADAPVQSARRSELLASRPVLARLLVITLLMITAQAAMETTFALWANDVLRFGPHDVAMVFVALGLVTVAVQGGGAGALAKRLGERTMLLSGIALFALGFLALIFARDWLTLWPALALLAIGGGAAAPALQSLISAHTTHADRGVVMGMNQSSSALGRVIGPIMSGPAFDALGASAPFAIGAALLGAALAFAWSATPRVSLAKA